MSFEVKPGFPRSRIKRYGSPSPSNLPAEAECAFVGSNDLIRLQQLLLGAFLAQHACLWRIGSENSKVRSETNNRHDSDECRRLHKPILLPSESKQAFEPLWQDILKNLLVETQASDQWLPAFVLVLQLLNSTNLSTPKPIKFFFHRKKVGSITSLLLQISFTGVSASVCLLAKADLFLGKSRWLHGCFPL